MEFMCDRRVWKTFQLSLNFVEHSNILLTFPDKTAMDRLETRRVGGLVYGNTICIFMQTEGIVDRYKIVS